MGPTVSFAGIMSDCEEDSGVHSQLQDERIDSVADNEGMDAALGNSAISHLIGVNIKHNGAVVPLCITKSKH